VSEAPETPSGGQLPDNELRRLRRRRRVILALCAAVFFAMAISSVNMENDIWWQLKSGEDVVTRRVFHTTDVYSWTAAGKTWTQHEWLAEVAFYTIWRRWSWAGLIAFKAVVVLAVFAPLLWYLNRTKANLYVGLLVLVTGAVINTRGNWTVFPSLFEYLFIVWAYLLLEQFRRKRSRWVLVALPFLSLVWANTHGSFLLLDAMIIAYVAASPLERWLARRFPRYAPLVGPPLSKPDAWRLTGSLAVSLLAPLLSPNGAALYAYPFRISLADFARAYVNEYQPFPVFRTWDFVLIGSAVALVAATVGILAVYRRRAAVSDVLLLVGFSFLAFRAFRHLAVLPLVTVPVLVRYLAQLVGEYRGALKRTLLKDAFAVTALLFFLLYYKTVANPFSLAYDPQGFPEAAVAWIRAVRPAGPMLNHYNYGGYLIGNLPEYPVFIDGRLEMYLDPSFGDYYTEMTEGGPQWARLLNHYGVNFILANQDMPVVPLILGDAVWKLVYWDDGYLVFVRDIPENRAVIARYHDRAATEYQRISYYSKVPEAVQYESDGLKALKRGRLDEAMELLSRALIFDRDDVRARVAYGYVLLLRGQPGSARMQFERALEISPAYEPARRALVELL
jgi:tetratricopeptide (TPR) repeat protein